MLEIDVAKSQQEALKTLAKLKKDSPKELKKAINTTARQTKKALGDKAQETYVIKKTKFNKEIAVKNATNTRHEAILKIKGAMQRLSYFQIRKNEGIKAAAARVRKERKLKRIINRTGIKAFVTTVNNGEGKKSHTMIAQRLTKDRFPIVEFNGPSNPEMVGGKSVYGKLREGIQENLRKNINEAIKRSMAGK